MTCYDLTISVWGKKNNYFDRKSQAVQWLCTNLTLYKGEANYLEAIDRGEGKQVADDIRNLKKEMIDKQK